MFTGIRLKIRNFFKRNKKIILVLLAIWLIIILINNFFKHNSFQAFERTTYKEHESVMGTGEKVPEKLKEPINTTIDTYFNYCNNKQYNEAYAMVSDECKEVYFPKIEAFKEYIDIVFNEKKIYYLQNFSNYNGMYIYRMRIMEDLMATGLTGKDDLYFYEEKIALKEEKDGKISLSLRQFITTEELDEIYEDAYVKIWIEQKDVFYEEEMYHIRVKNKTSNTVVLADTQELKEIMLQVGTENRASNNNNLNVVIYPDETKEYTLNFTKFFDEENKAKALLFNAVRVLPQYSGFTDLHKSELNKAEKLYSISMPF